MLIKYSKPNVVRARRNAFMRDFPDYVEIYPICQPSAVLPDISLILLSIGSYLELTIFREEFSSVAGVNVRTGPGLFSLGAFPTFRSHDFRHGLVC